MDMNRDEVEGLPNISGAEDAIDKALAKAAGTNVFLGESAIDVGRIRSAFAIALHMHQPLIPAGGGDLRTARLIGNLEQMAHGGNDEQRYNADIFRWCYRRMGEIVPQLLNEGKEPRVMLDYSGTLLWGFRQMGLEDVFGNLRTITCDPRYRRCVEWLGNTWGHAVAPSTPVQDFRLHVRAWQHHFATLFGMEALTRVRGFSPAEMALPNHPDVAYEFVRTLKECGYRWVLVQEHTVERPETGVGAKDLHLPHRLVCKSSSGETVEILALIKTQGSDTKLVAQMQPYYEARGLSRVEISKRSVPQLVVQIADGENGGVMMNEFPSKYMEVVRESTGSETRLMNGTEYLEHLFASGIKEGDLSVVQPIFQKRIWEQFKPGQGTERLRTVLESLHKEDSRFHVEGGSWTSNVSWVKGYSDVIGPMEKVSAEFNQKILKNAIPSDEHRYRNALFHLLSSQTSCYRYWGQGTWTDYGREICRRVGDILRYDFP
jgi:hypothetical protein